MKHSCCEIHEFTLFPFLLRISDQQLISLPENILKHPAGNLSDPMSKFWCWQYFANQELQQEHEEPQAGIQIRGELITALQQGLKTQMEETEGMRATGELSVWKENVQREGTRQTQVKQRN